MCFCRRTRRDDDALDLTALAAADVQCLLEASHELHLPPLTLLTTLNSFRLETEELFQSTWKDRLTRLEDLHQQHCTNLQLGRHRLSSHRRL